MLRNPQPKQSGVESAVDTPIQGHAIHDTQSSWFTWRLQVHLPPSTVATVATGKPNINRHSFLMNTQDTTHNHINPQTSHTRQRQCRCDPNSKATRLHTPM